MASYHLHRAMTAMGPGSLADRTATTALQAVIRCKADGVGQCHGTLGLKDPAGACQSFARMPGKRFTSAGNGRRVCV